MTTLTLPYPPSVNRYWRSVRGQVLISAEGRRYRQHVGLLVLAQGAQRFGAQRLALELLVSPPDARRRDIDNLSKAVLDALQHAGVYDDDNQIDDLRIRRGDIQRNSGALHVTLRTIP